MTAATPFFLNESIPELESKISQELFENCLRCYITEIPGEPVEGVFHTLGELHTLDEDHYLNMLFKIKDLTLQGRAVRLFSTPIPSPIDEKELLSYEGYTIVNGQREDNAFGHIAAFLTGGFLFTFPVYKELKSDYLRLYKNSDSSEQVPNYYGDNHPFVTEELERRRISGLSFLEKLEELPAKWRDSFEHDYKKLSQAQQEAISDLFLRVKKNGYKAEEKGQGMRHVGSVGNLPLYELKVFYPAPIRVFFSKKNSTVYITSMFSGKSGAGKKQDEAIKNAEMILKLWLNP